MSCCFRKRREAQKKRFNNNRHVHFGVDKDHKEIGEHQQCRTCQPEFKFVTNYVSTTKYNLITFLPKNLFEQFQKKANLYFLIVAIISLTPLSPKTPFVSVAPLVFVLAVSAVKEAIEDYARYKMDREINNTTVKCWRDGEFKAVIWQDLVVGDVLQIYADEAFPADLVLLKSSSPQGACAIETSNLDGETNLKVRQAAPETYAIQCDEDGRDYIGKFPGCVLESSPPNKKLDMSSAAWSANIQWIGKVSDVDKVALGMNQLLLRGCILRNTKWILAVVMFTGEDTKLMLNNTPAKHKRSNVDRTVDRALYILFTMQACLCSLGAILNYRWLSKNSESHWYLPYRYDNTKITEEAGLSVLTFLVLLDILIPISLYVSMELVKFVQAWYINVDMDMYYVKTDTPAKARTSNLNEELGQISYIFSDKTGTLTANIMKFIGCSVDGNSFGVKDSKDSQPLERKTGIPPAEDLPFKDNDLQTHIINNTELAPMADEFLTSLATCHSVLPDFPTCSNPQVHKFEDVHRYEDCKSEVDYQAASPDEKALVIAAKNNQYYYYHQTPREFNVGGLSLNGTAILVNILGEHHEFHIYELFKFDSERARMSVILRDPRDNKIKVYCKGSDTKMFPLLTKESQDNAWPRTKLQLTEFARLGLRTLVIGYKEISEEYFVDWMRNHKAALSAVDDRAAKVTASYDAIEHSFTLLGATAIEDKLQEGVPKTIATLAKAGIKIWVLTGDKVETAVNIGKSCKLLTSKMEQFGLLMLVIKDDISEELARKSTIDQLDAIQARIKDRTGEEYDDLAVIVSGRALSFMFTDHQTKKIISQSQLEEERKLRLQFLSVCKRCKAVVCCRVSPHQKAEVVNLVKKNIHGAITLAIGDGANDVPMIKAAHVGIGISGLEGLQAVMASDYAIAQFRFLEKLLLIHGQWSYRRTSLLILYSFYKNITIAMTQIWFAISSGWSAQMFYDPYAGSVYNMIFTAFPVMLAAIFNKECSKERTLQFPELYKSGINNENFNLKKLFMAIIEGVLQSLVLFYGSVGVLLYFNGGVSQLDGKNNDVWVTSTAMYTFLVIVVNIRIGLDTTTWNWLTFLFLFLSVFAWFCFALIYCTIFTITPNMFYVAQRLFADVNCWLLVLLIPAICILPDLAYRYYRRTYYPKLLDLVAELDYLKLDSNKRLTDDDSTEEVRTPRATTVDGGESTVQESIELRTMDHKIFQDGDE